MTVLTVILIALGAISLGAAILVTSACILSGKVSQTGRVPVVDTDSGETGGEREAENAWV